jgi:hypothetical protein
MIPSGTTMQAAYRSSMRVYEYRKVPPREFKGFLNAESKGTYINRRIKPAYDFEELSHRSSKPRPKRKRNRP